MLIKDVYINIGSFHWEEKNPNSILHLTIQIFCFRYLLKILKYNLEK